MQKAKKAIPAPEVGQEKVEAKEALVLEKVEKDAFIKKPYPDAGLNQIYSTGLEFAFVNAQGEQCHPFAYCKDFLQDAIWAEVNKDKSSIYGFTYAHKKNPAVDLTTTRVAVRYTKKTDFRKICRQSEKFLNAAEKDLGFSPTKLIYGGRNEKSKTGSVMIFEGDKKWMHAPPMISMYTLLIRVGLNFEGGDWKKHLEKGSFLGSNDNNYLSAARPVILKMCGTNILEIFAAKMEKNYPSGCDVGTMHNYSGIQSLGKGNISAEVSKHWQKKSV